MKILLTIVSLTFYLLSLNINSYAQGIGINGVGLAPDKSAILDLNTNNKGFLITRVDTANITSPAFGLMTLSPVDSCLFLFNGKQWMGMGGGGYDCACNCESSPIDNQPTFKCGDVLTDKRDNETYGTVQIKNQCWMSENLNFNPNSGSSWCYDDDPAKCVQYGRLYEWNTAMDNASESNANPSGVQGVCPTGWHFPSDAEWKELEIAIGMTQIEADKIMAWRGTTQGNTLKTSTWGGNNSSGFTALPGGMRTVFKEYKMEGVQAYWWTATEIGNDGLRRLIMV